MFKYYVLDKTVKPILDFVSQKTAFVWAFID